MPYLDRDIPHYTWAESAEEYEILANILKKYINSLESSTTASCRASS